MQATEMTGATGAHEPYARLSPMRCRFEFQGQTCNGRGGDINWDVTGTHAFRCQKCRSYNVIHVHVVENVRVVEAGA